MSYNKSDFLNKLNNSFWLSRKRRGRP